VNAAVRFEILGRRVDGLEDTLQVRATIWRTRGVYGEAVEVWAGTCIGTSVTIDARTKRNPAK
jgi:hypothetical protein